MSTENAEPTADDTEVPAPAYAQPAASVPRPADEPRPELLIGGAFVGGLILAKLLGRRHGR